MTSSSRQPGGTISSEVAPQGAAPHWQGAAPQRATVTVQRSWAKVKFETAVVHATVPRTGISHPSQAGSQDDTTEYTSSCRVYAAEAGNNVIRSTAARRLPRQRHGRNIQAPKHATHILVLCIVAPLTQVPVNPT